ncbi:MAG: hypothetical protein FWC72_04670, partial [Oscillospiraceae bacterium]|nr:hypothetical protein [Oscillospiraceae bacterium]
KVLTMYDQLSFRVCFGTGVLTVSKHALGVNPHRLVYHAFHSNAKIYIFRQWETALPTVGAGFHPRPHPTVGRDGTLPLHEKTPPLVPLFIVQVF